MLHGVCETHQAARGAGRGEARVAARGARAHASAAPLEVGVLLSSMPGKQIIPIVKSIRI